MTSTLLQQLPKELEVLVWTGQLQKIRFNEYSALRFLSNAMGALRDAKTPELSLIGRYIIAHEGIYALCLGSIYLHGLLPSGPETHSPIVVQLACEMLHLSDQDRDTILNVSKRLEEVTYQDVEPVEKRAVLDLLATGNRALAQAQQVYPDWFL